MANTNVFRGSDATLTLASSDPDVPEGVAANEVIEGFQLSPVGRASDVEVYVQTDLKAYHEIGKRHPAQLRPGNINVSGKIGRAYKAKTTPHMFIINSDGLIVYDGAIDNTPLGKEPEDGATKINYVDKALAEILSGQKISISNTKPYGCSVKYAN